MSFVNAPINDLLIRIKNSYMARRTEVNWVTYSKFKENVLALLKRYNFVLGYEIITDWNKKFLNIKLKEVKDPVADIPVVKLISTPSRKTYVSYTHLKTVAWGRGIWIISTSKWLMATHEAKKNKVWWELIAEIY